MQPADLPAACTCYVLISTCHAHWVLSAEQVVVTALWTSVKEVVLLLGTMVRDWSFQVDPGYRPVLVPSITLRPRHGMPGVFHKAASR